MGEHRFSRGQLTNRPGEDVLRLEFRELAVDVRVVLTVVTDQ